MGWQALLLACGFHRLYSGFMGQAFWQKKKLHEMTADEWESLCDGCGLCCLHKLQDVDTKEITDTGIACKLLDCDSCRCKDYANRLKLVPDCVQLSPDNVGDLQWLPATCGYRLVYEGKDLYDWHPLVSGSAESVHEAGISARGEAVSEDEVGEDYWRKLEFRLGIKITEATS